MIQLLLILVGCFLLLFIAVYLGALLVSAGFYSKDKDFFEAMQKIKNLKNQTSSITNKDCLLLENKNIEEKE